MPSQLEKAKAELHAVGMEYEELRILVGGKQSATALMWLEFVPSKHVKRDAKGERVIESQDKRPPLVLKVAGAASKLRNILFEEGGEGLVSAFFMDELPLMAQAWDGVKDGVKWRKENEIKKPPTQLEKNIGVAREIMASKKPVKDKGKLGGVEVEGDKKDARVEALKKVKPRGYIGKRLDMAEESLVLGCELLGAGKDATNAAKAFRHGLWMGNFENRDDVIFWETEANYKDRRRWGVLCSQVSWGEERGKERSESRKGLE